jgi:hypothetical protein
MIKILHKIGTILILALFASSCASYVGRPEIESGLNKLIGTRYSATGKWMYWTLINETQTHLEFEKTIPNGCAYAVLVNKSTNMIESWRFTSAESACEQSTYVPGV